uniref:BPTI/Kunitz inhibitor domain-containing protein n=1 Tax=Plectus sambesii TaxID=2011161 RepID=A0A914WHT1_9BILA
MVAMKTLCSLFLIFSAFTLVVEGRSSACSEPKKTGPCRAAFPRWYYSIKANDCLQFTYGGCQGNGNNFNTKQECDNACADGNSANTRPVTTTPTTSACPILTTPIPPLGCNWKGKVREDGCNIVELDCPQGRINRL